MEREISSAKNFMITDNPIKGTFDCKHLKDIHRFLFQDLYTWAGEFRTVNISKGDTMFCLYQNIEYYLEDVFLQLKKQDYLINTKPDSIYERLAFYFGEINAAHSFREGNGRSQRVFVKQLARVAGYEVNFKTVKSEQMIEASASSWRGSDKKLEEIFKKITTPISAEQQLEYAKKILPPNHKAFELLDDQPSVLKKLHEYKSSKNSSAEIKTNQKQKFNKDR